jgi:hypothetical protein
VGGGQTVIDKRGHQRQERRHQGARHDVVQEVAPEQRQGRQDQAEHDAERDQDQEHQDVGAEHPPRVATHGSHAVAERLEHSCAPEHDEGDDEAPVRQQDQAGHDKQEEADRDGDAGQDRGPDNRPEIGEAGPHRLAQVEIDPAVADILDRLD